MTKKIEVGDIIQATGNKQTSGYGVVTEVDGDTIRFKRLIDRHGNAVNVGVKKAAVISYHRNYVDVLSLEEIHKMHEASIEKANMTLNHLITNRKR